MGETSDFGDARRAVKHMNEDHGESVLAYAHYYCGRPDAKAATLLDATDKGFLIKVDGEEMWLAYPQECKAKSSRDLRKVAVYMHQEAFSKLGFAYRLEKGYYSRLAKMGFAILTKKVAKNKEVVYPVVAAAALMSAYTLYRHMSRKA